MPTKLRNESGEEIEAFTAEEVKTLEESKEEELKTATEQAVKLQEELNKLKDKDLNFSTLRSQKDEAEKKVKELAENLKTLPDKIKGEVMESVLKEHYLEILQNLAGGDEEAKKKIEHHYNRLSDPVDSKAAIEKKLRDAMSLSQDRVDLTTNAFASMGSAPLKPSNTGGSFTQEEVELGKRLAAAGGLKLTDDDFKSKK